MVPTELSTLLKLPPEERAELAMALWDSLTDEERDAHLEVDASQRAELDRRLAEHIADPSSAVPWEEVRRKFRDQK